MGGMNDNATLYEQRLSYRSNAAPYQCLAQPWFVRAPWKVYYPRHRCLIEALICGEKVFGKIAEDLEKASHSVDIITWGFDPGMVLVRGATAEDGERYGELLERIATRKKNPVKVRLLVWHDDLLSHLTMNNIPVLFGKHLPYLGGLQNSYYSEAHQNYTAEWLAQVIAGEIPNILFHVRHVPHDVLKQSLAGESVPKGLSAELSKLYASHHQKMLLIDYEQAASATGYVMGHNSLTDFWDTGEHQFRDRRRERFYTMDHAELQKKAWREGVQYEGAGYLLSERQLEQKARAVQSYIDSHSYVSKPYQDVSCRMKGPILHDLNHNFCEAWQESERPSSLFKELVLLSTNPLLRPAMRKILHFSDALVDEMDPDFISRRMRIPLKAFTLPGGQHSVQLLRTNPSSGEKTIKECYANLTRQTFHYIFIQNQYIQYKDWADHLIECVGRLRSAGYLKPIYVFLLTSTPESDGMDVPTYDVASKVGMSDHMKVEHKDALEQARQKKIKPPITAAELADRGINVFMGSLWTCADAEGKLRPTHYEEIYIHAKVAVVDDAAFTVGSANLNLRSMAMDSELNVLSEAKDIAFQLRSDLFSQCSGKAGPAQFGDMRQTFDNWQDAADTNARLKMAGAQLLSQLFPFYVDRKPGSPVV